MTNEERVAFENAYNSNVANCDRETLHRFMDMYLSGEEIDPNVIYDKFPDCYTSIMDAIGVWYHAIRFALTQCK